MESGGILPSKLLTHEQQTAPCPHTRSTPEQCEEIILKHGFSSAMDVWQTYVYFIREKMLRESLP